MGSYQSIYFGPYMQVKHVDGTTSFHKNACSSTECVRYNKDGERKDIGSKFCPDCGAPVEKRKFTKAAKVSCHRILNDEFENNMCIVHAGGTEIYKDREIIIPNGTQGMPHRFDMTDFCGAIDISDCVNIKARQLEWFDKEHGAEIKALWDNGYAPEICWGLVIHYS